MTRGTQRLTAYMEGNTGGSKSLFLCLLQQIQSLLRRTAELGIQIYESLFIYYADAHQHFTAGHSLRHFIYFRSVIKGKSVNAALLCGLQSSRSLDRICVNHAASINTH